MIVEELILWTTVWLLVMPWVSVFMVRDLHDLRLLLIVLGAGVPAVLWFVYSVVGLIRLVAQTGFMW